MNARNIIELVVGAPLNLVGYLLEAGQSSLLTRYQCWKGLIT